MWAVFLKVSCLLLSNSGHTAVFCSFERSHVGRADRGTFGGPAIRNSVNFPVPSADVSTDVFVMDDSLNSRGLRLVGILCVR